MSGDKLTYFLFLAGFIVTGVAGGLQTAGWRSRVFWGFALVSLVAAIAYLRAEATGRYIVGLATVWSLVPPLSVGLCLLAVSGREPRKAPPQPATASPTPENPPALNPALTADYLNGLVKDRTELEAKRKLEPHSNQLAKLRGQVKDIEENYDKTLTAHVAGLVTRYDSWWLDALRVDFKKDQAESLAVIQPKDWIEFTGRVASGGVFGWRLIDCEFVGRAEPPPAPPEPKKPRVPRQAASARKT